MEKSKFIILGAGAWGTAMAIHLSKMHPRTVLSPRDHEKASRMNEVRENSFYLPNISFREDLIVDTNFEQYIGEDSVIFLACPTKGLVDICERLKSSKLPSKCIVSLVKGLDKSSLKLPSEVISSILPDVEKVICLSGPTYAYEFALGKPAAMVLAGDYEGITSLQESLCSDSIRIYRSRDLRGVELGSCLKNIYAVGAGVLDGLNLGDNARAAYLTRSLREMAYVGVRLGGKKETFYGLSGLGDLIATAQGQWSRNRSFGYNFALGKTKDELLKDKTVEGYWSIDCFNKLALIKQLDAPILNNLYKIFYENYQLDEAVKDLITRKLKEE